VSRVFGAVALAAALLVQILLPALAASDRAASAALLSGLAIADGFCFGAAPPTAPGAASPDGAPAPMPDGRRHDCCVLCGTPGLAVAAAPVRHGPAWSRVVTRLSGRPAVAVVVASERTPIRPRAPPVA
jgi:hypothetical protein